MSYVGQRDDFYAEGIIWRETLSIIQGMYNTAMKYGYVCVAGTFDGLHAGHVALLKRAFEVGTSVLIGLTSEAYVKQYKNNILASSYENRHNALAKWITAHRYTDRATIVPIDDPFEPAASDPMIDALIVSEQSRARGEALNHKRSARGLNVLVLSTVLMVNAQDYKPISATRVRSGVIDRDGRLTMPDSLRNELVMPLGVVLSGKNIEESVRLHTNDDIISIGDQTTKTLLEAGITPRLMIIDNKVNRQPYDDLKPIIARRQFDTKMVTSGPGFISGEALRVIKRALSAMHHNPLVIDVVGEEDLLALPAIIEAPSGAVVYYGQPNRGMVEVVVTKENKKKANELLFQFT